MALKRRLDRYVKQWLAASVLVGLLLGIGFSIVTKPSPSPSPDPGDAEVSAPEAPTSSVAWDPLDRAYLYPDPGTSSDAALVAVCAGGARSVPGTPEPAALPPDRNQSVVLVTEESADRYSGDQTNMEWKVTDYTGMAVEGWTPSAVRQIKVSRAHLGYVVCVDQTGVTFRGTCGERDVVKIGVRVSVREAHSGNEIGAFDVAPANPTGCGPDPDIEYWIPGWAEFGPKVEELVRR